MLAQGVVRPPKHALATLPGNTRWQHSLQIQSANRKTHSYARKLAAAAGDVVVIVTTL